MRFGTLTPWTESWFVDEVRDLGDAAALRCGSDPSFRWGNLLVLKAPMVPGTRGRWEARFAEAFEDVPGIDHVTFAWTGGDGALDELEAAGYEPDRNTVRVATAAQLEDAGPVPHGFDLRPVDGDDWGAVLAMQLAECLPQDAAEDASAYRTHRERRIAVYRDVAAGRRPGLRGAWYLATLHGEPAGTMGVYVRDGLGRFQFVLVAAEHRRKGVATAMVRAVAQEGIERWGAKRLLIVGDEGTPADAIYARLGFREVPAERYVGACRKGPPARPDA